MKRPALTLTLLILGGLTLSRMTAQPQSAARAHDGGRLAYSAFAQPAPAASQSCERPLLDFRVVTHDANGRPVVDGSGGPVWEPALAVGSVGEPRHLTSAYFRSAAIVTTDGAGLPAVAFEFTDEGAVLLGELTRRIIGQQLGIFVDDELVASPTVVAVFSKAGIITGVTDEEAHDLAARINAEAVAGSDAVADYQRWGKRMGG